MKSLAQMFPNEFYQIFKEEMQILFQLPENSGGGNTFQHFL